jgi:hypothetical protein
MADLQRLLDDVKTTHPAQQAEFKTALVVLLTALVERAEGAGFTYAQILSEYKKLVPGQHLVLDLAGDGTLEVPHNGRLTDEGESIRVQADYVDNTHRSGELVRVRRASIVTLSMRQH